MTSSRRRQVVAALIAIVMAGGSSSSQGADWSGTWTTGGRDLRALRNIHMTARGWDQLADNLAGARAYTIAIAQSGDRVVVSFPGGTNNILTTEVTAPGAGPRTTVRDRGDWWIKDVTAARWNGDALEVTSTTSTGWWKDVSPEKAAPAATDFKKQLVIMPDAITGQLSVHVSLADEKG